MFLVRDGILYTPDRGSLQGITRKVVSEIAKSKGIEARAETVAVEMAYQCDEILSTTRPMPFGLNLVLIRVENNGGACVAKLAFVASGFWASRRHTVRPQQRRYHEARGRTTSESYLGL
ncbi:hypothetical protein J3458_015146 [Metarhizium acridum]|uniref:uncharacterized protein n=1 Tax=Metarhizium acridum TaxID=92637 RepID=UPI001C6C9C55|nr:hypothetical protein J3458_015146 [Metarhizium acridum]